MFHRRLCCGTARLQSVVLGEIESGCNFGLIFVRSTGNRILIRYDRVQHCVDLDRCDATGKSCDGEFSKLVPALIVLPRLSPFSQRLLLRLARPPVDAHARARLQPSSRRLPVGFCTQANSYVWTVRATASRYWELTLCACRFDSPNRCSSPLSLRNDAFRCRPARRRARRALAPHSGVSYSLPRSDWTAD